MNDSEKLSAIVAMMGALLAALFILNMAAAYVLGRILGGIEALHQKINRIIEERE